MFLLRQIDEPGLGFQDVFKQDFSRLHNALKKQLANLDHASSMPLELLLLEQTCSEIGPLAQWRNERAHPRVRIDQSGIVIFNWRTGAPLNITRDECLEKLQQTIKITVDLEVHGARLHKWLKPNEEADLLIEDIIRTLEGETDADQ